MMSGDDELTDGGDWSMGDQDALTSDEHSLVSDNVQAQFRLLYESRGSASWVVAYSQLPDPIMRVTAAPRRNCHFAATSSPPPPSLQDHFVSSLHRHSIDTSSSRDFAARCALLWRMMTSWTRRW